MSNSVMQDRLASEKEDPKTGGFAMGEEIYVKRSVLGMTYHHSGVHIGDGKVIHVHGEPAKALRDLLTGRPIVTVGRTTVKDFAGGDPVSKGPHPTTKDPIEASVIASSREGESWSYDPADNNCQHFSSEVVSGSAHSPEGDKLNEAWDAVMAKLSPANALEDAADWAGDKAEEAEKSIKKAGKKAKKKAKKFGRSLGRKARSLFG